PAATEEAAFGSRLDHDYGTLAGEESIDGSNGMQHQIESAVGLLMSHRRQELRQFGGLGANRSRAGKADARALARPLAAKKSGVDCRARAAERNEGDGDMQVFDRKCERGAHLIAVERAVTRPTQPARALLRPLAGPHLAIRHDRAGSICPEARSSRPVIFAAAKALEAKALIRQLHRPIGIALAGCDGIAHAADEHIAHDDLANEPQRGAVRQHDIDARNSRPAADETGADFLVAGGVYLPRVTVAVVEAPHAAFICGQSSGQRDADAVIV